MGKLQHLLVTSDSMELSLGSPIGSGGFGTVYLGKCKKTGRSVAIKVIDCGAVEDSQVIAVSRPPTIPSTIISHTAAPTQRVVREASVWATLQHPNVLPLEGFYLDDQLEKAWLISSYEAHGNIVEYLKIVAATEAVLLRFVGRAFGRSYFDMTVDAICF